ncbi:uncharacterized protein BCR38DRAFT_415121 [Pseudomassariella vexata]|uniref:Cyanovirin-N domain-containing protein n=1 Tax=Pseudomassariella vexata TaxID=1141098 RepID=A0A1Y2D6R7_9PEZI|nr:uncharacterized protein BCR38DRAFT_415121 [Pseudomassariella vexata]ORY54970.1 hypothetical protein BCR38DRAFT_415121 [Pseudomassariella vexata]
MCLIPSLLTATLLALFATVLADGGYASPGEDQCKVIELWWGRDNNEAIQVIADCPVYQGEKSYYCSKLPLDKCFGNIQGQLKPIRNGGFSSSCHDCKLESTKLSCYCERSNTDTARWQYTEIETIGQATTNPTCYCD